MTPASALLGVILALGGQAAAPLPFEEVARKAAAARDKDQLDEAIRWYREGARLRPRWDEGLWYLATLLYEQDRFAEARDAFRRFLVLKPEAGPAWALQGMCEFKLKEYDAALRNLEKGTDLGYGTNTAVQRSAWFHLSMLLVRAGQFELAGQDQLLRRVHAAARRLLAVPQRGVENGHAPDRRLFVAHQFPQKQKPPRSPSGVPVDLAFTGR